MKLLILYQPQSEHARLTEEFVHDLTERYPDFPIESIDVDSIHGAQLAQLYDVVQYPAFLVVNNEGVLLKSWMDESPPLIDEVAGYMRST